MAEAHVQLGLAMLDLDRNQDAVVSLKRAIALDPTLGDTHITLGMAMMRLSDFPGARDAFAAALEHKPDDLQALVNIGACLIHLGQPEKALPYQYRAASIAPNASKLQAGIAASLGQMQDIPGSIAACLKALDLAPDSTDVLVLLGHNYTALGQFQDADAVFRRALALSPDSAGAQFGLAGIGRASTEQAEQNRLAASFTNTGASTAERISAGFALGATLDKAGRYDEAFRAYAAANTLGEATKRASGQVFDLPMLKRYGAWAKTTFVPELFEATKEWGNTSDQLVFIVGMPRSGTTLVEQILASHPLIFGAGELKKVPRLVRQLDEDPSHVSPLQWDRDQITRLSNAHVEELTALDPAARRITDKLPDNIQLLGQIAVLFPHARVIVCRRDLRDVCLSCYFQHFGDGNEWSHDLASCAERARQISGFLDIWQNVVPLQMLEVDYETLINDLEGQSRRLIAFLGLEWDDACLAFHETDRQVTTASQWQVRQPLYATSVNRWRLYQSHLAPLLAGLRGLVPGEADSVVERQAAAASSADRAQTLLIAGSFKEAAAAARQAIDFDPDQPAGHGFLGLSLLELHEFAAALPPLREATRLAPGWLNPRIDLASALTQLKDFAGAAEAWRQALTIQPDNAEALSTFATVLIELGQDQEALEVFRRAVELAPDDAVKQAALGVTCLKTGNPYEAETALRRARFLTPNEPEYMFGLGEALSVLGRFEEAASEFRSAVQYPAWAAKAHEGLATIGQTLTSGLEIPSLRTMLANPNEDIYLRAVSGFALARALDRAGSYDDAFESCALANRFVRERHREDGRDFDPRDYRNFVDRTIDVMKSEALDPHRTLGVPSELPVFIVGMPRSGTSLVEQIAASHPAVVGLGETKAIKAICDTLDTEARANGRDHWLAQDIRQKSEEHLAALKHAGGHAIRVIDKMPDNLLYLGQIAWLFPGARIILCRRDPRDIGLSCFMTNFTDGMEWTFDLGDIGSRIYESERLAVHWRYVLPLQMLEVQYEELVADLEGQSRRLIDFLGLNWNPACLAFHTNTRPVTTASHWQVRQPLYDSSVGRWKHYRSHLDPLVDALKELAPAEI